MMRICRFASVLALAFAGALTLSAKSHDPFSGKWTLNVARSQFDPGPPLSSETVTIVDRTTTMEGAGADGRPFKLSFTAAKGKPVPIDGIPNATVETKVSGHTVDHTWSVPGGATKGHGVVSKDGKTMTYTQTGTDRGKPVHNVMVFEKQ